MARVKRRSDASYRAQHINANKTIVFNDCPWKIAAELNYQVGKTDAFGPEWMINTNITPAGK